MKSEEVYELTDSDREWASALVKTVEARGGVLSHIRTLPLLAESQVLLNSGVSEYTAYAVEATNKYILHSKDGGAFLVDFDGKQEISLGSGGTASHQRPRGKVLVVLHTTGRSIGGISVSGWWRNPWFGDMEAKWH